MDRPAIFWITISTWRKWQIIHGKLGFFLTYTGPSVKDPTQFHYSLPFRKAYLSIKSASWMAQVINITEYKPREDFLLLDSFQPDLQIFTRSYRFSFYIIGKNSKDFHVVLEESKIGGGRGGERTHSVQWHRIYFTHTNILVTYPTAANYTLASGV